MKQTNFEEAVLDASGGKYRYVEDEHFPCRRITDQILIQDIKTGLYSVSTIKNLRTFYKYRKKVFN